MNSSNNTEYIQPSVKLKNMWRSIYLFFKRLLVGKITRGDDNDDENEDDDSVQLLYVTEYNNTYKECCDI
jgi:hypothetical protein